MNARLEYFIFRAIDEPACRVIGGAALSIRFIAMSLLIAGWVAGCNNEVNHGLECGPTQPCEDGLVCKDGACVASVCAGVACSGHGTCADTSGVAACVCNDGYSASGLQCIANGCTPTSHASSLCDAGDVYWFDSCGGREELKESCANGCTDGACNSTLDPCTGVTCSGHGACNANGTTAYCTRSAARPNLQLAGQVLA